MPNALALDRQQRIRTLCRDHRWDALLVYGNAWRCDYLRYVSDFPILEGHGFALMQADGGVGLGATWAGDGLEGLLAEHGFGIAATHVSDAGYAVVRAVPTGSA